MIQDIMPLRLRNEFENRQPGKDSRMMIFRENEICIKKDGKLDFPLYGDLEDWCQRTGSRLPEAVYLFSVGGESYFLTSLPGKSKKSQEREVPRSAGRETLELLEEMCGGEEFAFVRMFEVRAMHPGERVFGGNNRTAADAAADFPMTGRCVCSPVRRAAVRCFRQLRLR